MTNTAHAKFAYLTGLITLFRRKLFTLITIVLLCRDIEWPLTLKAWGPNISSVVANFHRCCSNYLYCSLQPGHGSIRQCIPFVRLIPTTDDEFGPQALNVNDPHLVVNLISLHHVHAWS